MTSYKVTWEIDIEAEDPLSAAQEAREIQLNPENIATVFTVVPDIEGADTFTFDLLDLED